jgi:SAM-dependent methyltransferase
MLRQELFRRMDESPDALFYEVPRLVTHIDDAAIAAVTQLYREHFPAGGAILDLMSSWVSHLPEEIAYRRVVGLGMNAAELAANARLHARVVQDLNEDPHLPFADAEFDAGGICIRWTPDHPSEVLRECGRVVRPGGPLVITFSTGAFRTQGDRRVADARRRGPPAAPSSSSSRRRATGHDHPTGPEPGAGP